MLYLIGFFILVCLALSYYVPGFWLVFFSCAGVLFVAICMLHITMLFFEKRREFNNKKIIKTIQNSSGESFIHTNMQKLED